MLRLTIAYAKGSSSRSQLRALGLHVGIGSPLATEPPVDILLLADGLWLWACQTALNDQPSFAVLQLFPPRGIRRVGGLSKSFSHGSQAKLGRGHLDCYWVGSFDFNFWGNQVGFSTKPPKS